MKFCGCVRAELCLQLIVSAAFDLVPVHLNYSSDYVFESDCVLCFDHFLSHTQALSCIAWILIKNMPPPESVRLQYDVLYNAGNINKQKSLETRNNYSDLYVRLEKCHGNQKRRSVKAKDALLFKNLQIRK